MIYFLLRATGPHFVSSAAWRGKAKVTLECERSHGIVNRSLHMWRTRTENKAEKHVHSATVFVLGCLLASVGLGWITGCRAPSQWRDAADHAAYSSLSHTRYRELGRDEPLRIEPPSDTFRRRLIETQDLPVVAALSADPSQLPETPHWDPAWRRLRDDAPPDGGLLEDGGEPVLTLRDALQLAAHGNHDYQRRKEALFSTALALDLEQERFRTTLAGMLGGRYELSQAADPTESGVGAESSVSAKHLFRTGIAVTAALTADLVNMLRPGRDSAYGLRFDSSISIPLGRGARRHIVMEPLTQAQRDLIMAVWEFEHFKNEFAIDVATRYFNVLAAADQVRNATENQRRLETNARRARRMAEAGRLPEIQVDQALQEALRASSRSVAAARRHADVLDQFKMFLGVPPDARLQLDRGELDKLVQDAGGVPLGETGENASPATARETGEPVMDIALEALAEDISEPLLREAEAIALALEHRLDLRADLSRVEDAQRRVVVAADALRAEVTLSANAGYGEGRSPSSADRGNVQLRFDEGRYRSLLQLDLPWERTAERNALRTALVQLEQAVRRLQAAEDRVKLEVRGDLRALQQALENLAIQTEAIRIAQRRVRGSDLFLDAGRAAIRDVLESQDALLQAQNDFTDAVVEYRLRKLGFQYHLGLLSVDADGWWTEWDFANHGE